MAAAGLQFLSEASPPAVCGLPELELSYSLGVLDGSIQGAEEGTAFLHDTMEMHLMQKVTLRIAEILGTKPGQSRQAGILQKVPGEKQCWNRHGRNISFCFSTLIASSCHCPCCIDWHCCLIVTGYTDLNMENFSSIAFD